MNDVSLSDFRKLRSAITTSFRVLFGGLNVHT
jgi:hypothetical protein